MSDLIMNHYSNQAIFLRSSAESIEENIFFLLQLKGPAFCQWFCEQEHIFNWSGSCSSFGGRSLRPKILRLTQFFSHGAGINAQTQFGTYAQQKRVSALIPPLSFCVKLIVLNDPIQFSLY